jgi:hypothetical protein
MRFASGVTDQYLYFVAVDSTDLKTRETGLSSFTVYRSRNGGAATAMTTPTVAQLSAANMPGVYSLLLDEDMTIDAGDATQEMVFHITQAAMAPVTRVIELYDPAYLLDIANAIESGLTVRGALRLNAAALAGKVSGAGTGTETFRNAVADSKNRLVSSVDTAGNRTAVTTDVT